MRTANANGSRSAGAAPGRRNSHRRRRRRHHLDGGGPHDRRSSSGSTTAVSDPPPVAFPAAASSRRRSAAPPRLQSQPSAAAVVHQTPEFVATLCGPAVPPRQQQQQKRKESGPPSDAAATARQQPFEEEDEGDGDFACCWSPSASPLIVRGTAHASSSNNDDTTASPATEMSVLVAATTNGLLCFWTARTILRQQGQSFAPPPSQRSAIIGADSGAEAATTTPAPAGGGGGDDDDSGNNNTSNNAGGGSESSPNQPQQQSLPAVAPDFVLDIVKASSDGESTAPRMPIVALAQLPTVKAADGRIWLPKRTVTDTNNDEKHRKSDQKEGDGTAAAAAVATDNSDGAVTRGGSDVVALIVAVTDFGDVCIVSASETAADVRFRFRTDDASLFGVTSACATTSGKIALGYESGYLEVWDISCDDLNAAAFESRIACRGKFSGRCSIRRVSELVLRREDKGDYWDWSGGEKQSTTGSADTATEEKGAPTDNATDEYLILIVQSDRQRPTGSMIEVIDLSSLETAWQSRHVGNINDLDAQTIAGSTPGQELSLDNYWVLPTAGMEVVDASSIRSGNNSTTKVNWIPSAGTDCILPIISSSSSSSKSVACGLADGTVCILSASVSSKGEMSWGIKNDTDQMLLTYPCIGLGKVSMACPFGSKQNCDAAEHLVCCLRGATSYLLPLHDTDEREEHEGARVISYPHDLDTVTYPVQQVQGFTAGNLVHRNVIGEDAHLSSTAVMVYAWPGGLIDVHSCRLIQKDPCPRTTILSGLVDNDSVKMLHAFLDSFGAREELNDRGHAWQAAFDEIKAFTVSRTAKNPALTISLDNLCSSRFVAFRSLLLELSKV